MSGQMIEIDLGINLLHLLVHAVMALLCGIAKELNKLHGKGFSFSSMCSSALISSVAGILFYFLLAYFKVQMELSVFFAGIAGWLGGNWIDFLGLFSKKFLGNVSGVNITPEEERSHSELINK